MTGVRVCVSLLSPRRAGASRGRAPIVALLLAVALSACQRGVGDMALPDESSLPQQVRAGDDRDIVLTDDGQQLRSVGEVLHEARTSFAANNVAAALQLVEEGLVLDPSHYPLWKQKARIHETQGEFELALGAADRYLAAAPLDPEVFYIELQALVRLGMESRFQQRIAELGSLESLTDDQIGQLIRLVTRLAESEATTRALITAAQGEDSALVLVLDLWRRLLDGDMSLVERFATEFRPQSTRDATIGTAFALAAGERLGDAGEHTAAAELYLAGLAHQPAASALWREAGWALRRAGNAEIAASTWQEGLPTSPDPLVWLGWIIEARLESEDWSGARQSLDRALDLDPGDPVWGGLYLFAVDMDSADTSADTRIASLRDDPTAARLAEALLHHARGNDADALVVLAESELTQRRPDVVADLLRRWAEEAIEGQRWDAAARLLEALPQDFAGAEVARDLGWTYWALGRQEDALTNWHRALRSGLDADSRFVLSATERILESSQPETGVDFFVSAYPDRVFDYGYSLLVRNRPDIAAPVLRRAAETQVDAYGFLGTAQVRNAELESAASSLRAWLAAAPIAAPEVLTLDDFAAGGAVTPAAHDIDASLLESTAGNLVEALLAVGFEGMDRVLASVEASERTAEDLRSSLPEHYRVLGGVERARGNAAAGAAAYEASLRLAPEQGDVWVALAQVAQEAGDRERTRVILTRALQYEISTATAELVRGNLADLEGRDEDALTHWEASLRVDPEQVSVRVARMEKLLALGRAELAREELTWFLVDAPRSERVMALTAVYAARLDESEAAAPIWADLVRDHPETTWYGIERARTLFRACQPDEAIAQLESQLAGDGAARARHLLLEIGELTGRYSEILAWSAEGLATDPSNLDLLEARARAAEELGDLDMARAVAADYLATDPDSTAMRNLHARAVMAVGTPEESAREYQAILARNPFHRSAQMRLRDLARDRRDAEAALEYALQLPAAIPGDQSVAIPLAVSYAEKMDFTAARRTLKPFAELSPAATVALLYYDNVHVCELAGSWSVRRWESQVRALVEEGHRVVGVDEVAAETMTTPPEPEADGAPPPRSAVVIVVRRADSDALAEMDAVMERLGASAILVVEPDSLQPAFIAGVPSASTIRELVDTGRWEIALTGEVPIDQAAGPMLDELLAAAASNGLSASTFFYPDGDSGHQATASDAADVENFRAIVAERFEHGLLLSNRGFVFSNSDPRYMPVRRASLDWSTDLLLDNVQQNNPVIVALVQGGNIATQESRYGRAEAWFRRAAELGADSADLHYYWGNNAYRQGDYPVAYRRLEQTPVVPVDQRIEVALGRVDDATGLEAIPSIALGDDNEGRYKSTARLDLGTYLSRSLAATLSYTGASWSRDGLGSERASIPSLAIRYHVSSQYEVEAELSRMVFAGEPEEFTAYRFAVDGPLRIGNLLGSTGRFRVEYGNGVIETVEAIRDNTHNRHLQASVQQRIGGPWDLTLVAYRDDRTDGNKTIGLNGRIARQFTWAPYLSVGYAFRLADSDIDPAEYFAPEQLQQHQVSAILRWNIDDAIRLGFTGALGTARDRRRDWRVVGSLRGEVVWRFSERMRLSLNGSYQESPTYIGRRFWSTFLFRF